MAKMSIGPYIVLLPDVALEKIFSFLTYDEIAKNRGVCKRFNQVGSKLLSRGFVQVEKRHSTIYKRVKALLPRRESERRTHPLAKHCDILSAIETRISMLNMTFSKYIDSKLCCFIPGKVIDEIERILRVVGSKEPPPRTHELLQELRDISSMAMEYFDEQILPTLKMQMDQHAPNLISFVPQSPSRSSKYVLVEYTVASEMRKMRKLNRHQKVQLAMFTTQLNKIERRVKRQNLKLKAQSIKIKEQERKIQEHSAKMHEQEATIADLRKHIDEWEQRFSDLTAEVRAKDDHHMAAGGRTNAPPMPPLIPPPQFHLPNIKPRKAQVLPPRAFSVIHADLERKRKYPVPPEIPNKLPRNVGSIDLVVNHAISTLPVDNNDCAGLLTMTRNDIGAFTTNVIGSILANPMTTFRPRKRKMAEGFESGQMKK